jgi:hypothetical protein
MTEVQLTETVVRIDETLSRMYSRLFGNGQPGEIEKHDNRLRDLEEFRSRTYGGLVIVSLLVTLIGGVLLAHLFKGQ